MNVTKHLDYDALNTLKEIMENDFFFLIETFLQDSSTRVEALAVLVKGDDSEAIRRAAHSFKGSCSNIGALYLATLCSQLEEKGLQSNLAGILEDYMAIAEEFNLVQRLLRDYLQ